MNKVQIGIDLNMVIASNENQSITEEQIDIFTNKFNELVESFDWHCGGGVDLSAVNQITDLTNNENLEGRKLRYTHYHNGIPRSLICDFNSQEDGMKIIEFMEFFIDTDKLTKHDYPEFFRLYQAICRGINEFVELVKTKYSYVRMGDDDLELEIIEMKNMEMNWWDPFSHKKTDKLSETLNNTDEL